MLQRKNFLVSLTMALVGSGGTAVAELIYYDSEPAWIAAVGEHHLEDFESQPTFELSRDGGEHDFGDFTFSTDANHGRIGVRSAEGYPQLPWPLFRPLQGQVLGGDAHAPEGRYAGAPRTGTASCSTHR